MSGKGDYAGRFLLFGAEIDSGNLGWEAFLGSFESQEAARRCGIEMKSGELYYIEEFHLVDTEEGEAWFGRVGWGVDESGGAVVDQIFWVLWDDRFFEGVMPVFVDTRGE